MNTLRRGVVGASEGLAIAVGLAIAGWSPAAEASGFASQRIGGEQGSVVATNPTALYFNPGGLGFSGNGALGVYGTLALRDVSWTHTEPLQPGEASDAQLGNSGRAHLFNVFGGPALGGSVRFGNFVLGGGFFAPFFGRVHWDKNGALTAAEAAKYPLAVDGVQRWSSIDVEELSVLYFSVGGAYRLGPLSIGAAGNVIRSTIVTNSAKNPNGQGFPNTPIEGRAVLDVRGWDFSFGAGAMLEVLPDQLWLGASYQAKPGLGAQKLDGTLFINSQLGGPIHYDVVFTQTLPDVIRAGVRWKPKRVPFELRLFGDLTRWSAMTTQCITWDKPKSYPCQVGTNGADQTGGGVLANFRRYWKDTYGARLGVGYWVKPEIEIQLGGGYETAAVPDQTMTPDTTDADNIAATLGARFQLTDALFLSASYTQLTYLNRDNTGKSDLRTFQVPTGQEDGGGKYTQWIGLVSGNLEALF
jgi:long-chain fatty acid transport protein